MNKFKIFIAFSFLVTGILSLASCSRDNSRPVTLAGNEYYPLALGKYIVYDVDSIYWDDVLKEEIPVRWQFRYDFVDTFRNDEGNLTFTVDVRKRKASTTAYTSEDVIHITPFDDRIEFKYNYLQYIVFRMPVDNTIHWNPLTYILIDPENVNRYPEFASSAWDAHYENIGAPYNNEIFHFDQTVTVNNIDDAAGNPSADTTNVAHKYYSKEIYAKGVGMVYKQFEAWDFNPLPPYGTGLGYKKGYAVTMRVVEYN